MLVCYCLFCFMGSFADLIVKLHKNAISRSFYLVLLEKDLRYPIDYSQTFKTK